MADRVKWGRGRRDEFINFMNHELTRIEAQRAPVERRWDRLLEIYRAPQPEGTAQFPFYGASNRVYPYAQMTVNPIWANAAQTLHAGRNLWTISPLNEKWVPAAKPLQDYLTFFERRVLNMWQVNNRVLMEMMKLGTGIYKTDWRHEQNIVWGFNEDLDRERQLRTRSLPVVDHVSLANFLIPPESINIDPDMQGGAQWVAERHRLRPAQLRAMAQGSEPFLPVFDPEVVKNLLSPPTTKREKPDLQKKAEILQRYQDDGRWPTEEDIEFFEVHARFDTSGNGIEEDIIVHFHRDTNQILRATYNPASHGKRPYDVVRYVQADGFYGIGVCEQAEWAQNVVSELMNNMLDKTLLQNAPMFSYPEGAAISPNEPFFPGKMWPTPDGAKIEPLFLHDGRGSIDYLQNLNFILSGANQLTGVDGLRRGSIDSLPSRTPATTVQSLLAESNTLFDLTIKDMRMSGLSNVGLKVLQLLQQHGTHPEFGNAEQWVELGKIVVGSPEGDYLDMALRIPDEDIALGIGVELTATSGVANVELSKQNFLTLLQLGVQLAQPFIQLVQIAEQGAGSMTGSVALQTALGLQELYMRLLEQHDIRNAEDIVPNVQEAIKQTQVPLEQTTAGAPGGPLGPEPGAAGPGQVVS